MLITRRFGSGQPPQAKTIQFLTFTLTVVPAAIAISLQSGAPPIVVIVVSLTTIFGLVFAFNSAVHSYLVLAFTADDVALNVGFYYMANSGGRLAGTVLSGLVYQFFGLVGCLWVSTALVLAAGAISIKLPNPQPSKAIPFGTAKPNAWKAEDGD